MESYGKGLNSPNKILRNIIRQKVDFVVFLFFLIFIDRMDSRDFLSAQWSIDHMGLRMGTGRGMMGDRRNMDIGTEMNIKSF